MRPGKTVVSRSISEVVILARIQLCILSACRSVSSPRFVMRLRARFTQANAQLPRTTRLGVRRPAAASADSKSSSWISRPTAVRDGAIAQRQVSHTKRTNEEQVRKNDRSIFQQPALHIGYFWSICNLLPAAFTYQFVPILIRILWISIQENKPGIRRSM